MGHAPAQIPSLEVGDTYIRKGIQWYGLQWPANDEVSRCEGFNTFGVCIQMAEWPTVQSSLHITDDGAELFCGESEGS